MSVCCTQYDGASLCLCCTCSSSSSLTSSQTSNCSLTRPHTPTMTHSLARPHTPTTHSLSHSIHYFQLLSRQFLPLASPSLALTHQPPTHSLTHSLTQARTHIHTHTPFSLLFSIPVSSGLAIGNSRDKCIAGVRRENLFHYTLGVAFLLMSME